MAQRITVIGGSGRTGKRVVERVHALGAGVRVLSRRPRTGRRGVEIIAGSITDAESVVQAMTGADGVVVVVESAEQDGGPNGPEQVHFHGMQHVIAAAGDRDCQIVLVSQIYITRPERYPQVRNVIHWRDQAERALRASGLPYTIVRPAWLTDEPAGRQGVRLEQGDTGEGEVSRADVAEACAQAFFAPASRGKTFELYNGPGQTHTDWNGLFAALHLDREGVV